MMAKRKNKNRRKAEAKTPAPMPEGRVTAVRPTPERASHAVVRLPTGQGKDDRPAVVEADDMVARLYEGGVLSYDQEQAARRFQQLHADYMQELGLSTGRSCLDIGPVGHDGGEGNPAVLARHKAITQALGLIRDAELRRVVIRDNKPRDLLALKSALTVVATMC